MFKLSPSDIEGCHELQPRVVRDERGRFVKVFHEPAFAELGLETRFVEEYYSASRYGVIRGFHFQEPPADHVKLVYCVHGEVFDVVLDLRVGSPTYGKTAAFKLSSSTGNFVYIPKGLAHGFCSLSEEAILVYKVSTVYSPAHDSGILWSSTDVVWPVDVPVISERDRKFVRLENFVSPFTYGN